MRLTRLACAIACALLAVPGSAAPSDSYPDSNVSTPCRHWSAITPSDSADLTILPKALYVGGGGDIAMIGADAPSAAIGVTWRNVPAASLLPTRPRRILATGTTATYLVGCY